MRNKTTILVIDDHPQILRFFSVVLGVIPNCYVKTAGNLQDAEQILLRSKHDILIADLDLSGDDSGAPVIEPTFAFINKITGAPDTFGKIKVAVNSSYIKRVGYMYRALRCGAIGFVAKAADCDWSAFLSRMMKTDIKMFGDGSGADYSEQMTCFKKVSPVHPAMYTDTVVCCGVDTNVNSAFYNAVGSSENWKRWVELTSERRRILFLRGTGMVEKKVVTSLSTTPRHVKDVVAQLIEAARGTWLDLDFDNIAAVYKHVNDAGLFIHPE